MWKTKNGSLKQNFPAWLLLVLLNPILEMKGQNLLALKPKQRYLSLSLVASANRSKSLPILLRKSPTWNVVRSWKKRITNISREASRRPASMKPWIRQKCRILVPCNELRRPRLSQNCETRSHLCLDLAALLLVLG